MKILFISHYDNMYGANRALLALILGMKAEGKHEPQLVLPAEGELTKVLAQAGVPYFICSITQWQAIYKEPISFFLKKEKRKRQIAAELETLYAHYKDAGIDVIHSNSSVIGTGAMLAERLNCRHIWHIREFAQEHFGMKYFYPKAQVKKYYENACRLVAISDALRKNLELKYPAARVVRVYDGVTTEKQAEKTLAVETPHTVCFCYVAYLFPKKQQLEVMKAARELKAEGLKDFRIIFAGTGQAAYEKTLRKYAEKHGLAEVEFAGFVSDVPAMLQQADVGIMASAYEGFGLVTVEYMLAGLPVIGYESGGTPEIVTEECGILYRDKDGLKQAMRRLAGDASLRRHMGENGRKRAAENFRAETNTAAIMKLYDEL